jgi:hypothetical protein
MRRLHWALLLGYIALVASCFKAIDDRLERLERTAQKARSHD